MDDIKGFDRFKTKYCQLFGNRKLSKRGGIFQSVTRRRLAGIERKFGGDRSISDFWLDVKSQIETALHDIQLFIEAANQNHEQAKIPEVINLHTLEPILDSLLQRTRTSNLYQEEIALLLIIKGFSYFETSNEASSTPQCERRLRHLLRDLSQLVSSTQSYITCALHMHLLVS